MCEKGRKGVSGERMLVAMEINPSHALKVAMETEIKTQSVLSVFFYFYSSLGYFGLQLFFFLFVSAKNSVLNYVLFMLTSVTCLLTRR